MNVTTHDELNFVFQKVLVRDLFCGEISNNVVSLVRQQLRPNSTSYSVAKNALLTVKALCAHSGDSRVVYTCVICGFFV